MVCLLEEPRDRGALLLQRDGDAGARLAGADLLPPLPRRQPRGSPGELAMILLTFDHRNGFIVLN